ncbi:MAG: hypothetical protein M0R48_00350 [Candidatus Omnitrophica bacterium]|jgi:hypothetical protein|nr:hypothetical protein [Candidatus Omnitrophota bacterium]
MSNKILLVSCLLVMPFCGFAQPVADTSAKDDTASPTVQTDEREISEGEGKVLKDFVITAPQLPSIKTTEEKEKK